MKEITLKGWIWEIILAMAGDVVASAIISRHFSLYWGIAAFIAIGGIIVYTRKYHRKLKLLKSGLEGYYYSFPLEENPKVWREVSHDFKYLGISSDSILEAFRSWINSLPQTDQKKFYFLLMDPEAEALRYQICHEKGVNPKEMTPEVKEEIEAEIEAVKERIRSAIKILKNTNHFKTGRLKIKLYDAFTPWWMYIFDNKKLFLGILKRGERSSNAPLLMIHKLKNYTSVFDAFYTYWNSLW
ncbi:MAG: hypothetical protein DRP09_16985, partial [Candidatus Thorarchaeota archaeon]